MKNIKFLSQFIALSLFLLPLLFIGCRDDDDPTGVVDTDRPNILFIIADDMGLDATNGYPEGNQKPTTPHLDELMNSGLKFTNLWVNPICSPTRSSIITGKYGYTTDVLTAGDDLSSAHQVLQAYINEQTGNKYATAVIGKWHLAQSSSFNPETLGIDYYAGLLKGSAASYTSWKYTNDGITSIETEYATKKFTDLAIDWVSEQDKPWFLWLAYNAPHFPLHLPPNEMHSQGVLPTDEASINDNPLPYFLAAIEAMDYQIGRLLDGISQAELDNTIIIFIGDNGSPGKVAQFPFSVTKAKGSVYQGGVNVPMFVTGATVTRTGTEDALLNGTDLFATISNTAGVDIESINDSKNFSSLFKTSNPDFRDYIYAEIKDDENDINRWCIRNAAFKLIQLSDGSQEFYNIISDPYEMDNLLDGSLNNNQLTNKESLEAAAAEIRQ